MLKIEILRKVMFKEFYIYLCKAIKNEWSA
ncbi:hypothetical protein AsAng_0041160 [Aureispira anguillae]|uniref:Uncharacterized protein n=1 Tax=Aureispira anguillae TaxID=2864201 RepID=A0A915YHP9_9BACT|nr:hypothetical protein AsAng_0041160 [Aureispira anguillae]